MPFLSTRSGLAAKGLGFLASNSPVGQQIYTYLTSGGSTITATAQKQITFTVPDGVTSISVLCVGAGGWTIGGNGNGGGGGALAYTNNYAVIPGQTYTVIIGRSDSANQAASSGTLASSRDSTFGGTICGAGGGQSNSGAGVDNVGGAVLYGTGGAGGVGKYLGTGYSGGGGGAGGYSGTGGTGGIANSSGSVGTGGSGGGGGGSTTGGFGGFGGGAGIYGLGSNGTGGASDGYAGVGGSGGEFQAARGPIRFYSNPYGTGIIPVYGAGAGGIRNLASGSRGDGGFGVVRIVWPGNIRQFPSTNVGNF